MSAPTIMHRARTFLAERRRLGFQARNPGYALISFARFVERRRHHGPLTVALMAEWARRDKAQRGTAETWARRLKILRPFARWMRQFEPRTAVPDESIFGPVPGRVAPHIYRDEEIVALLAAARTLHPRAGLRPATFEAVFGPSSPSHGSCHCTGVRSKRWRATDSGAVERCTRTPRCHSSSARAAAGWAKR